MNQSKPKLLKLLAVDVGTHRMGFAVWNPASGLTSPLPVYKRRGIDRDLQWVSQILSEHSIEAFVVGLPTSLAEKETESTKNSRYWIEQLKSRFSLPVFSQDESLSTKEAESILRIRGVSQKKRKDSVDSLAAALFLEEFLKGQTE